MLYNRLLINTPRNAEKQADQDTHLPSPPRAQQPEILTPEYIGDLLISSEQQMELRGRGWNNAECFDSRTDYFWGMPTLARAVSSQPQHFQNSKETDEVKFYPRLR